MAGYKWSRKQRLARSELVKQHYRDNPERREINRQNMLEIRQRPGVEEKRLAAFLEGKKKQKKVNTKCSSIAYKRTCVRKKRKTQKPVVRTWEYPKRVCKRINDYAGVVTFRDFDRL